MASKITCISLVFLFLLFNNKVVQPPDTKELTVEANHSTVQFIVPIANGITRVTGKFTDYNIDLDFVDNDLSQSSISAIIQVKSINTGISARDEHLRTADFFDVEKYPEISFISERIIAAGDSYRVYGKFTMHGVTKDINFSIMPTGKSGENTFGFSSRLVINRVDYGVGADFKHSSIENFLADEINIEIDFWTKKRKTKTD